MCEGDQIQTDGRPLTLELLQTRVIRTSASLTLLSQWEMVLIPWGYSKSSVSLPAYPAFFLCSTADRSLGRHATGCGWWSFRAWVDAAVWLDSVKSLILPDINLFYFSWVTTTQIFSEFYKIVDRRPRWNDPTLTECVRRACDGLKN